MIRIGVVVQRYGSTVLGGAETLAREVAERLNAADFDITVFTTTARDYVTWENEYPAGESILRGVRIRRFPVERVRDIDRFNRRSEAFFSQPPASRNEEEWIAEQGPVVPSMIDALAAAQNDIDLFMFFTYLYYPTIKGLEVVSKPAVLFPTAHEEPPLFLEVMKHVFSRPQALFFLTQAEMDLVNRVFSPSGRMELVRTGIDVVDSPVAGDFRRRFMIPGPFMLFAGRIERGKGLEEVFAAHEILHGQRLLDFVLIGKKWMDIPPLRGLKYLGFVTEEEKRAAFKAAWFSVQPSTLESLSITTLESFAQGTSVLVNSRSAALREHLRLSEGGLPYGSVDEFVSAARQLTDSPALRRRLGRNGRSYVTRHYTWQAVMARIERGIREILS